MHRLLAALLLTVTAAGCVRRLEITTVYPDGSADLVTIIEGDPGDVRDGDALPTDSNGWKTREETRKDKKDKETLVRYCAMHLNTGKQPPASYAKPGTLLADVALKMPGQIVVEKREDGTYYHFRRTFKARSWAPTGFYRHKLLESEEMNTLGKKEPKDLSAEERTKMAKAFIEYERLRQETLLDEAADNTQPPIPQDVWLQSRAAAGKAFDAQALIDRVGTLVLSEDSNAGVLVLEKELKTQARDALTKALADHKVAEATTQKFLAAYDKAQLNYNVTEDLADDSWDVEVLLPGKIVATDATDEPDAIGDKNPWGELPPELDAILHAVRSAKIPGGYSRVKWEFDGQSLFDRDITVRASSFVPKS